VWSKLSRYWTISSGRKGLLLEALCTLLGAWIAMRLIPFKSIAAWLGEVGGESPQTETEANLRDARAIGWAVQAIARRVPWDSRCLAQALAGTAMLRRRGLEGTVSFGAARDEKSAFTAHAWLRFGPLMVTGGPGHKRFQLFTTFARRR